MIAVRYSTCAEHPGLKGSLDCDECRADLEDGRDLLRRLYRLDGLTVREDAQTPIACGPGARLAETLQTLGWWTTPSRIEGRRRIYDAGGLLANICNEEETWELLEREGFVSRKKENDR